MKPVMIEVGLNENTSREENPHVPITPEEIADDIAACAEAGASIVHFHARDPQTGAQRTCDTAIYREVMLRVRKTGCDILMYPTYAPFLSGKVDPVQERFGHVLSLVDDPEIGMQIGPLDMGSLNLVMAAGGKLLPGADSMPLEFSVYQNPVPLLRRMLEHYDARGADLGAGHLRARTPEGGADIARGWARSACHAQVLLERSLAPRSPARSSRPGLVPGDAGGDGRRQRARLVLLPEWAGVGGGSR